ncbi:MAG TPA: hypothetical protein VLJ37_12410 [bacterium]|nr:hypothetical protein [bacterium]
MNRSNAALLNWATLGWAVLTPLTGVFASRLPALFHPVWALVTIPLLVALQASRIGRNQGLDKRASKIDTSRRYIIILLLVFSFFTGLGVQMGFFSLLFHQVIVWPMVVYMGVDCVRTAAG